MATFTLYEYSRLTPSGEPVKPPTVRTTACAFAVAKQLAAGTLFFEVIPDADAYMRVSEAGTAATTADEKIYGYVGGDGNVDPHARPYVYLTAA